MDNAIKHIYIKGLWGKYNINWENLNPDVNILVGINGSGKSTLLAIIDCVIAYAYKSGQNMGIYDVGEVDIHFTDGYNYTYNHSTFTKNNGNYNNKLAPLVRRISTFDIPVFIEDTRQINDGRSQLSKWLNDLITITGTDTLTFNNYRLGAINYPDKANEIEQNVKRFFKLIDDLFQHTDKKVETDKVTNNLIFRQSDNSIIQLEQLSSGEKQLLLILLNVFLTYKLPYYVLLMDEPEISLHIEWQQKLIDVIRELNPNCQLIIATHSPSIFGNGWGDKLVFMEDIMSKISE